jgi:hypothetical protein
LHLGGGGGGGVIYPPINIFVSVNHLQVIHSISFHIPPRNFDRLI